MLPNTYMLVLSTDCLVLTANDIQEQGAMNCPKQLDNGSETAFQEGKKAKKMKKMILIKVKAVSQEFNKAK